MLFEFISFQRRPDICSLTYFKNEVPLRYKRKIEVELLKQHTRDIIYTRVCIDGFMFLYSLVGRRVLCFK